MLIYSATDKGSVSNRRHRVNGVFIKIYNHKMSILSDRLRELRGPTSQTEMARQLGIQRTQWIKYETGASSPGAEILANICRVHACSADWLLGLDKSSPRENISVKTAAGGVSIGCGSGNVVRGTIVAGGDAGHGQACSKCPYKRILKTVSKTLKQSNLDV